MVGTKKAMSPPIMDRLRCSLHSYRDFIAGLSIHTF